MALDPLSSVLDFGKAIIERFIPDPKAKAEAVQQLAAMQQSGDLAVMAQQANINAIEAASPDKFTSRWRPFVGWVCGAALALSMVILPLSVQIASIVGHPVPMVQLDTSMLGTLLLSMLGMGGLRTYEKLNNVQGNH
jgi:hypothetical protein